MMIEETEEESSLNLSCFELTEETEVETPKITNHPNLFEDLLEVLIANLIL
jgi:hypothetical protein